MALFTMRLKDVLKYTNNIGLNGYPIFDEAYRDTLNGKIVDRYFNREIGMETIDMFQLAMRRKMNEIMPLYNKLYLSEQMKFDPLNTIDIETVSTGTALETGANSSTSNDSATGETHSDNRTNSNTRSRAVTSDTPQTMLSGDEDYASGASDSASETDGTGGQDESTEATSNSTSNGEDSRESESSGDSRTSGRQGMLGSEALMRYRESLLNIDVDIIDDLNELFMKIWSSGDEYHSHAFPYSNWGV